jgi:hypothetical protein
MTTGYYYNTVGISWRSTSKKPAAVVRGKEFDISMMRTFT